MILKQYMDVGCQIRGFWGRPFHFLGPNFVLSEKIPPVGSKLRMRVNIQMLIQDKFDYNLLYLCIYMYCNSGGGANMSTEFLVMYIIGKAGHSTFRICNQLIWLFSKMKIFFKRSVRQYATQR